jgi:MFS family permease
MAIPGMPQAMLVSVTVLSAVDVLTTYLPAIGEAQGLSVASVSLLLSARAGASFLSRLLMPWLIARGGRRRVLIFSTLVPALLLCLWPWIDNLAAMFVLVVVIGFGLGIGQPMTMVWVANRAPDESRGIALGMRLTVNRLGQISVPLAVGAIAGMAGLGSVFVSMAALLGASTIAVRGADFDAEISAREPPAAED